RWRLDDLEGVVELASELAEDFPVHTSLASAAVAAHRGDASAAAQIIADALATHPITELLDVARHYPGGFAVDLWDSASRAAGKQKWATLQSLMSEAAPANAIAPVLAGFLAGYDLVTDRSAEVEPELLLAECSALHRMSETLWDLQEITRDARYLDLAAE